MLPSSRLLTTCPSNLTIYIYTHTQDYSVFRTVQHDPIDSDYFLVRESAANILKMESYENAKTATAYLDDPGENTVEVGLVGSVVGD